MSRSLRIVPAGGDVLAALRDALAGGPALFVAAPGAPPEGLPPTVEQRVALVVETSGSSGRPKRVVLSADAVLANAGASESALGGPGQWVLALPDHYIAGLNVLARSLASETAPVAIEGAHFTAAGFVAAARLLGIPERFTALVPAQLATLLDDVEARAVLRDFRAVLVGGQATPRSLLERAAGHGIRVVRSYGSSETGGGCVYDGLPIGQTTVRIQNGEVWLGGPSLAEGYLGDPGLSAERFVVADGAHWFRTADSGTWDGERLAVTGRLDDVIVSGGVNVSLGAVERLLREQAGFVDAVVVAADDERWGQVPVAFTTSGVDPAAALAEIARRLGPAARPARVVVSGHLPQLPSGKADRVALAALAARPAD